MKKVHLHISVQDLAQSVAFYSKLFNQAPTLLKDDYAKWSLDNPALNFAISNKSQTLGLDHWGIELEDASHIAALSSAYTAAELAFTEQTQTSCCYAESNKLWLEDPQGVRCEVFYTLKSAPNAVMKTSCTPSKTAGKSCC